MLIMNSSDMSAFRIARGNLLAANCIAIDESKLFRIIRHAFSTALSRVLAFSTVATAVSTLLLLCLHCLHCYCFA